MVEKGDKIDKILEFMIRSLREGRKRTFHHMLNILSENVNMLLIGLHPAKDNMEVLRRLTRCYKTTL